MKNDLIIVLSVLVLILSGCFPEVKESPTKGYLKCCTDESFYNVVNDAKVKFLELYPEAKIDISSIKAREGIAAILNGDIRMFVSSRNFNKEEVEFVRKTKSEVKIFKFCYDGIAVIERENEKIDRMQTNELKELLLGIKNNYKIFIPEANSGVYEYLKTELLDGKEPVKVFITKSENDVVEKVKQTKNSIGIVGLGVLKNSSGIDLIEIADSDRIINGIKYYEPLAGYLVNGDYPLVRTSYIIINEIGLHVASGFTSFLTSYDGQKIVLENNLGPATVPVKIVQ